MNDEKLEQILKSIGTEDIPTEVHEIAQETSNNFSRSLRQSRQPSKPALLEHIMRSRTIKLAVAAVIIIAVFVGLPFLPDKTVSVALSEVLARVEKAPAFMYKMKMKVSGSMVPGAPAVNQDVQGTIIISNDCGIKMEMDMTDPNTGIKMTQQIYLVPDEKAMFTVMPEQKRYMRVEFTDDLLERAKRQNNDPREMIKQMMACEYTELSRSVVEGVEVEGFQTTDPKMVAGIGQDIKCTLWVDAKTWLPVLAEMDMTMGEQMRMKGTIYDFEWDVPVVAEDFVPVIPEDFEPLPTDGMKVPEITEEAAIEGLKTFADLTGRYPKKANMMDLMQEITSVMTDKMMKDKNQDMTQTERVTEMMKTISPVQSIALLHMTLVQDQKEPAYYGETVEPGDVEAVLLRWKINDSEYRVIFGDLKAADVSADELSKLENPSE